MEFYQNRITTNEREHIESLFPLLKESVEHDLTKRKVSSEIDLHLGFTIKKIEETMRTRALQIRPDTLFDEWGPLLHNGAQTWVGLDFQILQCTYHDLKTLFKTLRPRPNDKIVDLGAGYGRMGIFLHWYYPNTHFLGLELVKERVNEANRIFKNLNCFNKSMIESDLSKLTELPLGDVYFIYDFGSEEHIKKILDLLLNESGKILIVKGRICHNLIKKDPRFSEGFKIKNLDDVFLFYL